MSGADPKKLFYKELSNASDIMQHVGNAVGWQGLEDEGAYNEKNPGHAAGKITAYAAGTYLGGLLGGAGAAGGAAANAAGQTAEQAAQVAAEEAAKQAALEAAKQGATTATQQGATQGLQNSLSSGWNSLKDGVQGQLYRAVPGAGSEQAGLLAKQTGDFGAYGLGKTMEAAAGANGLNPVQQMLGQYAGKSMGLLDQAGNAAAKVQKAQQVAGLLSPQQPQAAPQQPMRPQQQGQPEPLPMPYSNSKQQLPPGVNPATLTEEQRRALRMQGYQV
jgi:hypothetical protein